MLLLSQDYGKHLLGVEDLLQKHALVEADIGIQAERVRGVNASAQKFATDGEGKDCLSHNLPPSHQRAIFIEADKLCVAMGNFWNYCALVVSQEICLLSCIGYMRCSGVAFWAL